MFAPPTIKTTYSGPTNCTGAKITATAVIYRDGGPRRVRKVVAWNHAVNDRANHRAAAAELAASLSWYGDWHAGELGDALIWVRQLPDEVCAFTVHPT